jgi:uncharacterized protein YigA (DUF484 family)
MTNSNSGPGSGVPGIPGITEQEIADYLANNPGFFERHAELLGSVQLTSPYGRRAVSLQERQMEMLRDRIKGLEAKIVEMIRHGQENMAIADKLHRWISRLLLTTDALALPAALVAELQHEFLIPQVAVRLWSLPAERAVQVAARSNEHDFAWPVSEDVKNFAGSLSVPYCGVNNAFEAAQWLEQGSTMQSLAMIPLRTGEETFGLLVLGSPDPTRYTAGMGTEFLVRIGEIASAALARLRGAREV